jgi:hypothetical protein
MAICGGSQHGQSLHHSRGPNRTPTANSAHNAPVRLGGILLEVEQHQPLGDSGLRCPPSHVVRVTHCTGQSQGPILDFPFFTLHFNLRFDIKSGMDTPSYENALVAASDEMRELLQQRSAIDARINQLKKTVEALTALVFPNAVDAPSYAEEIGMGAELGITEAIRQVLRESKTPLSAVEIKMALTIRGVDLSYANPGTVIHNTLIRLKKQGEIIGVRNPAGQTVSYALITYPQIIPPPPGAEIGTPPSVENEYERSLRERKPGQPPRPPNRK